MDRRTTIKLMLLAALPAAAGCRWTTEDVDRARSKADSVGAGQHPAPQFFSKDEFETVRILADLILPADDRSGSASDLKVPEFIDFMVGDVTELQQPMRDGLAWLDARSAALFSARFAELEVSRQTAILDEIAYPDDAVPEVSEGVAFFNLMRSLTASGFWTTKEGIEDIGYIGNAVTARWVGPPQSELDRLGLSFDEWDVV